MGIDNKSSSVGGKFISWLKSFPCHNAVSVSRKLTRSPVKIIGSEKIVALGHKPQASVSTKSSQASDHLGIAEDHKNLDSGKKLSASSILEEGTISKKNQNSNRLLIKVQ